MSVTMGPKVKLGVELAIVEGLWELLLQLLPLKKTDVLRLGFKIWPPIRQLSILYGLLLEGLGLLLSLNLVSRTYLQRLLNRLLPLQPLLSLQTVILSG